MSKENPKNALESRKKKTQMIRISINSDVYSFCFILYIRMNTLCERWQVITSKCNKTMFLLDLSTFTADMIYYAYGVTMF